MGLLEPWEARQAAGGGGMELPPDLGTLTQNMGDAWPAPEPVVLPSRAEEEAAELGRILAGMALHATGTFLTLVAAAGLPISAEFQGGRVRLLARASAPAEGEGRRARAEVQRLQQQLAALMDGD